MKRSMSIESPRCAHSSRLEVFSSRHGGETRVADGRCQYARFLFLKRGLRPRTGLSAQGSWKPLAQSARLFQPAPRPSANVDRPAVANVTIGRGYGTGFFCVLRSFAWMRGFGPDVAIYRVHHR